jgi:hypothetical protein
MMEERIRRDPKERTNEAGQKKTKKNKKKTKKKEEKPKRAKKKRKFAPNDRSSPSQYTSNHSAPGNERKESWRFVAKNGPPAPFSPQLLSCTGTACKGFFPPKHRVIGAGKPQAKKKEKKEKNKRKKYENRTGKPCHGSDTTYRLYNGTYTR